MRKVIFLSILFFLASVVDSFAQKDIKDILMNARDFDQAVAEGEAFFTSKYPGLSAKELCEGEHRDGDYVKFRRWQSFWQDRLNEDGTLGDPSAYFRTAEFENRSASGPYDEIEWTNISYENFITGQISMGRVTSVAFHPTDVNTFYVGAAIGGVWKTTDGGQSYTPMGDDLPFLAVSAIVVNQDNPDEIYIAISDHVWYGPPSIGVYKSIDAGVTWNATSLSFDFTQNNRVYWMIADPEDADHVFVGSDNGLFVTHDGFETSTQVNATSTFDVKFKPGDSSVVYLGTTSGIVFRSEDGGENFSIVTDLGNGSCLLATTNLNPEKLYARVGGEFYKSFDSGQTFSDGFNMPDNNAMLMISPSDENTLVGGSFDIHKSSNDGSSFSAVSHWLGNDNLPLIHVDQRNVFLNPLQDDVVYFCNDGGLYTLNPETETFVDLSDGLMITQFYDIAVSQTDEDIVGGGSQDNGNVYRDTNGNWSEYAFTGDGMNQDIDPTNANIRYWSYQVGGMRRWQNGNNVGIAPPDQDGNGAWETPYKLDYSNPDRIICAFNMIYESFDRGDSWDIIGDIFGTQDFEQLAIAPSNPNRIYAVRGSQVKVKDVFSNEWVNENLPGSNISDVEVDPNNMDIVYITVAGYIEGSKVYKSINAGDDWENISGSLPNVSTGAIETYDVVPGGLFVGTDAGVFYKDDTLEDWEPYGDLPNTRVEDIEIQYSAGIVRVGTHGRGVIQAPVEIGLCQNGENDTDEDGICDEFDICDGFDDTLLGTPCDDGDFQTVNDIYVDCDVCEGLFFVGVDELPENSVILYPNPTSGLLNVQLSGLESAEMRLFDLTGKLVQRTRVTNGNNSIDISALKAGAFVAKLSAEGITIHTEILMVE